MKTLGLVAVLACVLCCGSAVQAYTFDDVNVEFWVGSGSNEAITVVDFGGGSSYAFGYRWADGATAYSSDMLLALDGVNGLEIDYTTYAYLGISVTGISYDGCSITTDSAKYASYWWSGYAQYEEDTYDASWNWTGTVTREATDGDGETWTYAALGASFRELVDGVWDGWTQGENWVASAPTVPLSVPEPCTMAMLSLGGAVMLLRRRAAKRG